MKKSKSVQTNLHTTAQTQCKAHVSPHLFTGPTRTTARPLEGYFFFQLENDKRTQKLANKMEKYFGYSKRERDSKRPLKFATHTGINQQESNVENGKVKPGLNVGINTAIDDENKRFDTEKSKTEEQVFIHQKPAETPIKTEELLPLNEYLDAKKSPNSRIIMEDNENPEKPNDPNPTHSKKDLNQPQPNEDLEASYQDPEPSYAKSKTRQKRFISLFRRQPETESDNFLIKMVEFLIKNRKNVIPVVSVMREINTLVKSANGELVHSSKERNNYIGTPPPAVAPVAINLELGQDSKVKTWVKRMLGLGGTDKLTVGGAGILG